MTILEETLAAIEAPDAARSATVRLDSLTKPSGGLGYLESHIYSLVSATG
jgi:hypothetical protein